MMIQKGKTNHKKIVDFTDKSLLIVDDDNVLRERLVRAMEKKGYIKRNKKLEYTLGQAKNLKVFQTNYLINQKNLSDFCTTLFNLMKNSKFKID